MSYRLEVLVPNDTGAIVVAPTMKNNFYGATTGASIYNTDDTITATVDLTFKVTGVSGFCSANVGDVATDPLQYAPLSSVVVSPNPKQHWWSASLHFLRHGQRALLRNGGEDIAVTVNEPNRTERMEIESSIYCI